MAAPPEKKARDAFPFRSILSALVPFLDHREAALMCSVQLGFRGDILLDRGVIVAPIELISSGGLCLTLSAAQFRSFVTTVPANVRRLVVRHFSCNLHCMDTPLYAYDQLTFAVIMQSFNDVRLGMMPHHTAMLNAWLPSQWAPSPPLIQLNLRMKSLAEGERGLGVIPANTALVLVDTLPTPQFDVAELVVLWHDAYFWADNINPTVRLLTIVGNLTWDVAIPTVDRTVGQNIERLRVGPLDDSGLAALFSRFPLMRNLNHLGVSVSTPTALDSLWQLLEMRANFGHTALQTLEVVTIGVTVADDTVQRLHELMKRVVCNGGVTIVHHVH